MLYKDNDNQNEKGHQQTIEQPDINKLDVRSCRESLTYGAFQGAHTQHRSDGKRNGCLKVFLEKVCGNLKSQEMHEENCMYNKISSMYTNLLQKSVCVYRHLPVSQDGKKESHE
jgi:hypothetical protein